MKHEIDIPGLPEGWRAEAYRLPIKDNNISKEFVLLDGVIKPALHVNMMVEQLIVEKIQPRRIVLEEISREEYYRLFHEGETQVFDMAGSHWHEVKEGEL